MAYSFDWMSKDEVLSEVFNKYDTALTGELEIHKLQALHAELRDGGISLAQVSASISEVCATDACDKDELFDVLNEMDRRYFLVRDLQWEFNMLDRERKGTISERNARFLFQAVHDDFFSQKRWVKFLRSRAAPGSEISFAEIEVPLCNIPTLDWLEEEKQDEEREREELLRAKQQKEVEKEAARKRAEDKAKLEQEAVRRRQEADKRKKAEEETRKIVLEEERKQRFKKEEEERQLLILEEKKKKFLEEKEKKEEEAKLKREEEERRKREEDEKKREEEEAQQKWKKEELLKQQKLEREKEEKEREERLRREREEAMEAEDVADEAAEAELAAAEAAKKAIEAAREAKDEASRKAAEEAEKKALAEALANKERRLRAILMGAIKSRKIDKLESAISEAKAAKLPALKKDTEQAEKTLNNVKAGKALKDAINKRHLVDIEKSMTFIRKNGWEKDWGPELKEGERLASRLRRLEKIRAEILELKQSVISEIRSYQNPPPAVHKVMISVYILLGYKEKELLNWKNMQALLGKTGKEGLKRQVTSLDPLHVEMNHAVYANTKYLEDLDLETIRDISAGAATFYAWATNMIEEVHSVAENKERLLEEERVRKLEEAEEKKKEEERKKAREASKRMPLVKRTSQMPERRSGEQGEKKTPRDSSVGRKTTQEDSRTRSRSLTRGRENTKDMLSKSPARPGITKRANSKSPARA